MTWRAWLWVLAAGATLPACIDPSKLPNPTAVVLCRDDADCLPGYVCSPTAGRCANAADDFTVPFVQSSSFSPERLGRDGTVSVRVAASEPLSFAAVNYVRSGKQPRILDQVADGDNHTSMVFELKQAAPAGSGGTGGSGGSGGTGGSGGELQDGDGDLVANIEDLFGNRAFGIVLGTVTVDLRAPILASALLDRTSAAAGDIVGIELESDEVLAWPPILTVPGPFSATLVSAADPIYHYDWTVPSGLTSPATLSATLVDLAGNIAEVPVGTLTIQ